MFVRCLFRKTIQTFGIAEKWFIAHARRQQLWFSRPDAQQLNLTINKNKFDTNFLLTKRVVVDLEAVERLTRKSAFMKNSELCQDASLLLLVNPMGFLGQKYETHPRFGGWVWNPRASPGQLIRRLPPAQTQ